MDCIQSENKAVDKFGVDNHGFNPGDPGAGTLATYLTPAWCDGVQQEILNVIKAGGLVPSGADLSQMLQAINILISLKTGGPGEVKAFARIAAPAGWLKCNGAAVSRAAYASLFAVIGTTFGAGDGATTFNLPDLRGEFVRGLDDGRGVDAGRVLGSAQVSQNLQHNHTAAAAADGAHDHGNTGDAGGHDHGGVTGANGAHTHTFNKTQSATQANNDGPNVGSDGDEGVVTSTDAVVTSNDGNHTHAIAAVGAHSHLTLAAAAHSHAITVDNAGGAEARPRNVALLYCISY